MTLIAEKLAPLRADVRRFGDLLGEQIRRDAGDAAFARVENLRRLAISYRRGLTASQKDPELVKRALEEAFALLEKASTAELETITKSFAVLFDLVNAAEARQRQRRLSADREEGRKKTGSPYGAFVSMRARGLSLEDVIARLRSLDLRPVFTAHPTEAASLASLHARQRLTEHLAALDLAAESKTKIDTTEIDAALHDDVVALWRASTVRLAKPSVSDEIARALPYYESALFEAVPRLYRELAEGLSQAYETKIAAPDLPTLVRFGSWIGGDGDGNPYVTAETLREAADRARRLITRHYTTKISSLAGDADYRTRARMRRLVDALSSRTITPKDLRIEIEELRALKVNGDAID
ncbi:MAG: phosphoenolpyruvate carboxylase, partial [Polyangiaceae bacterium]